MERQPPVGQAMAGQATRRRPALSMDLQDPLRLRLSNRSQRTGNSW